MRLELRGVLYFICVIVALNFLVIQAGKDVAIDITEKQATPSTTSSRSSTTTTTSTSTTTTIASTTASTTGRIELTDAQLEASAPRWPRSRFATTGRNVPHFSSYQQLEALFPDDRLTNLEMDAREQTYSCLTRMLRIHDAISQLYGIPYALCMGTALGAMREHNFIPWDHDTDLWVSIDHRDIYTEALRRHLPPDLYVYTKEIAPKWHDGFYKIRDRRTCSDFTNHPIVGLKMGLMVDAFPFSFTLKDRTWMMRLDQHDKNLYYPVDDVLPFSLASVGDHQLLILKNAEKYLADYYGDWREPPPKKQQKPKRPYPAMTGCGHYLDNATESEMEIKRDFAERQKVYAPYTFVHKNHPLYSCDSCVEWCKNPTRDSCLVDNPHGTFYPHHQVCFSNDLMQLCRCHRKRPYYVDAAVTEPVQYRCFYDGKCTTTNLAWYKSCCGEWPFCKE